MLKIAQDLASSAELKKREEGLETALEWITSSPQHPYMHMLKAWNAFFFCMWHSDKPLVQHALAQKLAKTQHLLVDLNERFQWMKAFWEIMNSKWNLIDRLRLDKFLALLRYFIKESFLILHQEEWKVEPAKQLSEIFLNGPLSSTAPKGIIFFLAGLYLEELEIALNGNPLYTLDPDSFLSLFDPFFSLLAKIDKSAATQINSSIFKGLLDRWSEFFDSEPSSSTPVVLNLVKLISEKLFSLAISLNVPATNRTVLYNARVPFANLLDSMGGLNKRKSETVPTQSQKRKLEDGSSKEVVNENETEPEETDHAEPVDTEKHNPVKKNTQEKVKKKIPNKVTEQKKKLVSTRKQKSNQTSEPVEQKQEIEPEKPQEQEKTIESKPQISTQTTPQNQKKCKQNQTPQNSDSNPLVDEFGQKRKVTFNLEHNESVDYEELEMDESTPHRPGAKPKSGILKPSPVPAVRNKSRGGKSGRGGKSAARKKRF